MLIIFIIIPVLYIIGKIILFIIFKNFGKFTYEGFNSFGFKYDPKKDTFDATKNAWQKNFGYTHLYDVGAPIFGMVIDTEPIKFSYDNKNWLISFWKGQYGIATGAEIGVYNTLEKKINNKTIYFPTEDNEMLDMSFVLYYKNKYVTRIKDKHWWLATFKLGMFSNPCDLSMYIHITFKDNEMLNAFLSSFNKLKYRKKYYNIDGLNFTFDFKRPHSRKVWTRFFFTDMISQFFNRKKVELYNDYFEDYIEKNPLNNEKIVIVNDLIPSQFKNSESIYE